jgi:hypothetical protein
VDRPCEIILEAMQPLDVDLRLFTDIGGDALRLNPGRGLMARVMVADGSGRGVINIAGVVLEAELPRHIRAGEQVRLVVRHLDEQRVVLEIAHPGAAPAQAGDVPQAPPIAVPLPGGGHVRVADEEPQDAGGRATGSGGQTVALRYDAPALGPVDLRFELHPGGLRVIVAATPGVPLSLASDQAQSLQSALNAAGDRPAAVHVVPRRRPLDVYA